MFGAIIGDIVGSIYEWNNIKTKDFPLFRDRCRYTDDTVMTCAVAEGVMNGGSEDDFIDALKKYGRMFPNAGYGGRFRHWLASGDREPYNSYGNGSAMRVSPCAWVMDCGFTARTGMWPAGGREMAERSAAVTHNHPEGIKGALAVTDAIFMARFYFGGYHMDYDSPIDRLSDVTFFLNCGEEHSNAKTKGYSCTLLTLILFGIELAAYRKTIDESRRTELIGSLKEEIQKLNDVIDAAVAWCEENSYGKGMESLYVIGNGMHFGTAMEGQLKLMETQCIPTMFNDIVEFSHGMHRAITTSSNVILIRSPEEEELTDKTFEYLWKRKIPTVMINASKCLEMPGVINVTPFPFTRSILLVTAVIQVISAFVPERNGTDPNRASNNDYTDWAKTRI